MKDKNLVNFIYELNQLKRQYHSGALHAGVREPDYVAGHAWRASQIAYILAVMEGDANPETAAVITMVHDNAEARIGDLNKVNSHYLDSEKAENQAFVDQTNSLGEKIAKKWQDYFKQYSQRHTKEGIIARDADWLEQAFQAQEFMEIGYKQMDNWVKNVEKALETKSAKKLIKIMKKTSLADWWQSLETMTYKKLKKKK
jgi:putative hydrolase of HD superfamily